MNTLQMNLNRFGLKAEQILGRAEMKRIVGGILAEEDPFGTCMGCETTSDCSAVGKGTCDTCTASGSKHTKCCSGWHNES